MALNSSISFGTALILFIGGAAGGVVGSLLFTTASGARGDSGSTIHGESSELLSAIRQLSGEIQQLAGRPSAAASSPANVPRENTKFPAGDPASIEKLTMSLDRLAAALASAPRGSSSAITPPRPFGVPELTAVQRNDFLLKYMDRDEDEASRDFHFMTAQQVLDKFGRPDRMAARQDGVEWSYVLKTTSPDGGMSEYTFRFVISDGYVVQVRN